MEIHVVQNGETLQSIAENYKLSVDSLMQENGLESSDTISTGQSLVIVKPDVIKTVREGDSLDDIATEFNISLIQLYANNPYLAEREFIYPGDTIAISYQSKGIITTHGNTVPYIDITTLKKTLPYLTYLSVLNYTATQDGTITTYYDDTEIIQISKDYGVAPLMLLTTLTIQGIANIREDFDLILNEEFQNRQIEHILEILNTKGYYGINISLQYLSQSNIQLYESYLNKVTSRINQEGYPVFITINTNLSEVNRETFFEKIDYSLMNQLAQNIIFMSYEWAANTNPPSPISSINELDAYLEYILNFIPSEKIIIGVATIGYDWELPYIPGISSVNYLSFDRLADLAYIYKAVIEFDEISQTPYFLYTTEMKVKHIVWFIDARSINASLELLEKYELKGISIWNITVFNPQLWLIINSQYEIEKII
jgi:spore germination protein